MAERLFHQSHIGEVISFLILHLDAIMGIARLFSAGLRQAPGLTVKRLQLTDVTVNNGCFTVRLFLQLLFRPPEASALCTSF